MTNEGSDPGFLRRPPKMHPITAFTLAIVCIPVGCMIQGSIGGGLIGGGIGSLLMALWDTFRLTAGLVAKPSEQSQSSEPTNET
jgi:hypothetical protein